MDMLLSCRVSDAEVAWSYFWNSVEATSL